MTSQVIVADYSWTGERFEKGVRVTVSDDGTILAVASDEEPTLRLENQALLPGFVNAHSHAFQRGLRGRGERFPSGSGSFWSWREAMYGLVSRLDHTAFYDLCLQAFREMLASGITSVGEFHYLHHDAAAMTSDRFDYSYDELVLRAAAEAGIRIVLLNTFYRSGGIGQPATPPQRRFLSSNVDAYWEQMERLRPLLTATQSLGVVAHSIRAASPEEIAELHRESASRDLVFHMHVEEQQKEIDDSLREYGRRPMQILLDRLDVDDRFTAVHATHSTADDLTTWFAREANVCITPLTEANLGDGVADTASLVARPSRLSLGSDSNHRISMFEEMRWLEYAHRLRNQERGVFKNDRGENAIVLVDAATKGGARSLGLEAGVIQKGHLADFVAIDLDHEQLAGWGEETLLESIVFGASEAVVKATCVGGVWRTRA